MDILLYVDERLEDPKNSWIQGLQSCLKRHRVLDDSALEAGKAYTSAKSLSYKRKELLIYIHAVRVLGTTLGGVLGS